MLLWAGLPFTTGDSKIYPVNPTGLIGSPKLKIKFLD
jgi:hypothetical protein